jgi:hypothetical protein
MARKAERLKWPPILARAVEIVTASSLPMTLRQVFYRLVAEELIPNVEYTYKRLSALTAKGRRERTFPRLIDPTRHIFTPISFTGTQDARDWLRRIYRRPRTEGQLYHLILAVEKATQVGFLRDWFDDLGVPVTALRGYDSQSHVDDLVDLIESDPRPSVLLYAGDFDPSGEDIFRDFRRRSGEGLAEVGRVALDWAQVLEHELPPQLGKATDSRAAAFEARHGQLVQAELEALPPDVLRGLYQDAIDEYWDESAYRAVREREEAERDAL